MLSIGDNIWEFFGLYLFYFIFFFSISSVRYSHKWLKRGKI